MSRGSPSGDGSTVTPPLTLTLSANQTLYLGSSGLTQYANAGGPPQRRGQSAPHQWPDLGQQQRQRPHHFQRHQHQRLPAHHRRLDHHPHRGPLSGAGSLVVNSGAARLNAVNTYTGPTLINGGNLLFWRDNRVADDRLGGSGRQRRRPAWI